MPDTPSIRVEDVPFHHGPDGTLLARLYRPAGLGPFPALVSVHGGAWTFNDRTSNESLDRALAEAGILVMAPDFRMPPVAGYPASVQDVNLATRWLKHHAEALGSAPHRVGGLGTSSGGHQIALSALRHAHPGLAAHPLEGGTQDASLAFLAVLWGVLDPLARYRMARERNMEAALKAHHAWWPDEAAMADGNPQRILERGEAGPLPPLLLVQGDADTNLTPDMAARFAEAWRARGGEAALELFPGRGHLFATQEPKAEDSRRAIRLVADFVHRAAG